MSKKKSTHDTDTKSTSNKRAALLFAAKLMADKLQQEKAVAKLPAHIKLREHVSELEAAEIIQHVHNIQTETPDLEKRQSTPDKVLSFLRSGSPKSPQTAAKGANAPTTKRNPKV